MKLQWGIKVVGDSYVAIAYNVRDYYRQSLSRKRSFCFENSLNGLGVIVWRMGMWFVQTSHFQADQYSCNEVLTLSVWQYMRL